MKRKIIFALFIIFFTIAFLDSYDARSIEELSYVIAIGLDKVENDENILISVQVATPTSRRRWKIQCIKN